jgi:hypothetical protein
LNPPLPTMNNPHLSKWKFFGYPALYYIYLHM